MTLLLVTLLCTFFTSGALAQSPVLSITQPSLWLQWAQVNVTWSNIPVRNTTEKDWVGMYLVDWPATYVVYRDVPDDVPRVTFNLLNGRGAYVARYYRGNNQLIESPQIFPEGAYPNHPRLVPVPGDSRYLIVAWTSNRSTLPGIVFWKSDTEDEQNSSAVSKTYIQQDFAKCLGYDVILQRTVPFNNQGTHTLRCGTDCTAVDTTAAKLFYDPGWFHNATIGPLLPSTKYSYRFGELGGLLSDSFTFVSFPMAGSREDVSILYTADVGIGPMLPEEKGSAVHNSMNIAVGTQNLMVAANDRTPFSLWVFNGDLSYANGWMWIWERFMDSITSLSVRMPLAITIGNHELDSAANIAGSPWANNAASGGECGLPTYKRFNIPQYYSFDHGAIHFLMFNTELNMTEQRGWVQEDMARVDRTKTPWTVALMHRPVYGSYNLDLDWKKFVISLMGELFTSLGVDVVFMAHKHYYERMYPIGNVTYILDGMGGRNDFDPDDSLPYNMSAYFEFGFVGYTRLRLTKNATTLSIERVRMETSEVTDSVSLTKKF